MAIPGLPGSQVKNDGDLMRMIQDIQREIRELRAQNILATAGISTQPGGINVAGSIDVQGPATFEGTTNIGGNASITGTLSLPAGIIGNDALSAPISPAAAHADVTNFALATGANVEKVRATVAVPSGYTRALVMAMASMSNHNPGAADDEMYLSCSINGGALGWSGQVTVRPGKTGFLTNTSAGVITGISSSIYVSGLASSGSTNWAANVAATMNVDAMVIFLR